jgi:hypothetical protein
MAAFDFASSNTHQFSIAIDNGTPRVAPVNGAIKLDQAIAAVQIAHNAVRDGG